MALSFNGPVTLTVAIQRSLTDVILPVLGGIAVLAVPTPAQLIPDQTLGTEASSVSSDALVQGSLAELIEGGAIRGENLFHSFQDFNVDTLQRVYFANPAGIATILTRVTGDNSSLIDGTLGVDGLADLFVLNPNGIAFGPNAQLDIRGSFVASTAEAWDLGAGATFSAVTPEAPPLLAVNLTPGLQYGADQQGVVSSTASLAVGQNLTLLGANLELAGQLVVGGNLTLAAQDTVLIRDSIDYPFIAAAGHELTVQGGQAVDVFALTHPESGLVSGGDMVLRSPTPVIGDARYYSNGSFQIQTLDETPGDLSSPDDPLILALGDVIIGDYVGASLHILAGGAVALGNITIDQVETTPAATISPDDPILQDLATLELGNGSSLTIDGANQPTLDIRAGIDWDAAGGLPATLADMVFPTGAIPPSDIVFAEPTSDAVIVGNIDANVENSRVFITNRFARNPNLASAPILVADIDTRRSDGQAGSVFVDAFGDILTAEISTFISQNGIGTAGDITLLSEAGGIDTTTGTLNTSSASGMAGAVTLEAAGNITTADISSFVGAGGTGTAGMIDIVSRQGEIDTTAGTVSTSVDQGFGGTITFIAAEDITTGDVRSQSNGLGDAGDIVLDSAGQFSLSGNVIQATALGAGQGGNITVTAAETVLDNRASVQASSFGSGAGGSITISSDMVTLQGISILQADAESSGPGGNIIIQTQALTLTDGSEILSRTFAAGAGGSVIVEPLDPNSASTVTIDGVAPFTQLDPITGVPDGGFSSGLFATTEENATGQGGIVDVTTDTLTLSNGGVISARTRSSADSTGILIDVDDIFLLSGGQVLTTTFGEGNAGTLVVNARNSVNVSGEDPTFNARFNAVFDSALAALTAAGQPLEAAIFDAQNFAEGVIDPVTSGSGFQASNTPEFSPNTFAFDPNGPGGAGNILITAPTINVSGQGNLQVNTFGINEGGNILLFTQDLNLIDGAEIIAATFGNGKGGNVIVAPLDEGLPSTITIDGIAPFLGIDVETNAPDGGFPSGILASSEVFPSLVPGIDPVVASGEGGSIFVTTDTLTVSNGGVIDASTSSNGFGGSIVLDVQDLTLLDGGQILSPTAGAGNAGGIELTASGDIVIDGLDPSRSDRFAAIQDALIAEGGFSEAEALDLTLFTLRTINSQSAIVSDVRPGANADGGDITIFDAQSLSLSDFGLIGISTNGIGNAGSLLINVQDAVNLTTGGNIRALVEGGAIGNGGDVEINARTLTLADASQISASVFREADGIPGGIAQQAGDIKLNITDTITIFGEGPDVTGAGPFRSGLLVSTERGAQGDAGDITVETGNLAVLEGGLITALTDNTSDAGDINLTITDTLRVQDGGFISVDGPVDNGQVTIANPGNPGSINIQAAAVELVNGGKIRAVTASGNNGNINIIAQDFVRLEGTQTSTNPFGSCETCSEISTEAFGSAAQGGNITILVGNGVFASLGENSDIVANALGSNFAASIFIGALEDSPGFVGASTFSDVSGRTLESDLDASSTLTVDDGNVVVESTIELITPELPPPIVDSVSLIDRSCDLQASANASEFSIVGRGGLPPDPSQPGGADTFLEDLGTVTADPNGATDQSNSESQGSAPPATIREAEGWLQDERGQVYLVSDASDSTAIAFAPITCQRSPQPSQK